MKLLDIRYAIGAVALAVVFGATGPVHAAVVPELEATGTAVNNTLPTAQAIASDSFTTPVPSTVFSPPGFPTATILGTGGTGSNSDVDFFVFSTDGGLALFDIDNDLFTFDTILSLFDSTGTLIAFDDDTSLDDGSSSGLDSFIGTISLPSGTYFIAVTQFPNNPSAIFSCIGSASALIRPDGADGGFSLTGCTPGGSSFPALRSGVDGGLAYTLHISLENPSTALHVTKTADTADGSCDADCSLREAIIAANASPGGNTIVLPPGTYTLSIAGLSITDSLTITGGGAANTIIDGGGTNQVFNITEPTGFGITVEIAGVTIQNGNGNLGGGIFNNQSGVLTIIDSNISSNTATTGGGVFNSSIGQMTLSTTTVSGNSATGPGGGGICNGGTMTLTNTTVSGNSATSIITNGGGGIANIGTMTVNNVTVSSNFTPTATGNGIHNTGTATLNNTIIANNFGNNCFGSGTLTSGGHNLESANDCGLTETGDRTNIDPLLGPLQNNGGPTFTHALLPGSPALDAGDFHSCTATDQRGVVRPQDGDGDGIAVCDIGAYEVLRQRTVSDLDGDGKADIVWRHTPTGAVGVWLMDGFTIVDALTVRNVSTDWVIQDVGDVNGDGKADIVWRHTPTGAVGVWLMDGFTIVDAVTVRTVATDWVIQDVRDVNGDGKADIVWRHTPTGAVAVWLMDGFTIVDSLTVRNVSTDWVIQ